MSLERIKIITASMGENIADKINNFLETSSVEFVRVSFKCEPAKSLKTAVVTFAYRNEIKIHWSKSGRGKFSSARYATYLHAQEFMAPCSLDMEEAVNSFSRKQKIEIVNNICIDTPLGYDCLIIYADTIERDEKAKELAEENKAIAEELSKKLAEERNKKSRIYRRSRKCFR